MTGSRDLMTGSFSFASQASSSSLLRLFDLFARSALYVETGKTKPCKSCSPSLLRKVITFYRKDLRVGTGPERLGSLTHDSEGAPKVTCL